MCAEYRFRAELQAEVNRLPSTTKCAGNAAKYKSKQAPDNILCEPPRTYRVSIDLHGGWIYAAFAPRKLNVLDNLCSPRLYSTCFNSQYSL